MAAEFSSSQGIGSGLSLLLTPLSSLHWAEIRGSKETAVQPLPLYDTPYEPEDEGASPEGEGASWARESRLPEDDERPPEEYDQPWEWKKERISKAFAGESHGRSSSTGASEHFTDSGEWKEQTLGTKQGLGVEL